MSNIDITSLMDKRALLFSEKISENIDIGFYL